MPDADEQVDNLLYGLRADIADLDDMMNEHKTATHLRMNASKLVDAWETLGRLVQRVAPFQEAAE